MKKDKLKKKEEQLRKLANLIKEGNAGVDTYGNVVDIRENTNAVPIKKHS